MTLFIPHRAGNFYKHWGYDRAELRDVKIINGYSLKEILNALYCDTVMKDHIQITSKRKAPKLTLIITI